MQSLFQLGAGWITLFVIGTDLFVVAPLLPTLQSEFQVGATAAGLTVTAFSGGYCIAAPLFGAIADRVGRQHTLVACLLTFAAANLLSAEARTIAPMLIARLACGIAAAGVTPSVYALVGGSAPHGRRATWMAIVVTGLLSSLPIGAPLGVLASTVVGWPTIFRALGLGALLLMALNRVAWRCDASPVTSRQTAASQSGVLMFRLAPMLAWSTALYSMYTYLGAGLAVMKHGPDDLALMISVYGAGGFAGALVGGRLTDRAGPDFTMRSSLIGVAVCFTLLGFVVQSEWRVWPAIALTSLTAQLFFPAQQARLLNEFPGRAATALAWNNSALFMGMTAGSVVGGQAMALGGLPAILSLSACIALIAWVASQWRPILPISHRSIRPGEAS
jgi:predicted MFS family arabinose efflux permease